MNKLLINKVTIKRNVYEYKEGTKQPVHGVVTICEHLPACIIDKKLYVKYKDILGNKVKIQKDDIVFDEATEFKYTITDHPQLGGGRFHHWEATLDVLVNR